MKQTTRLPVQFSDYDVLGHVNSTTYLRYMETSRVQLMDRISTCEPWYKVPLVVVAARCEYQRAIHKADLVQVDVWTSRIGGRSWDLDYEISTEETGVSAIGRTTQVAFDHGLGRVVSIDDDLRTRLEAYQESPLDFRA